MVGVQSCTLSGSCHGRTLLSAESSKRWEKVHSWGLWTCWNGLCVIFTGKTTLWLTVIFAVWYFRMYSVNNDRNSIFLINISCLNHLYLSFPTFSMCIILFLSWAYRLNLVVISCSISHSIFLVVPQAYLQEGFRGSIEPPFCHQLLMLFPLSIIQVV